MASITALRVLLGASLGLGTLDLVWLDLALAPRVVDRDRDAARVAAAGVPVAAPAPAPAPAPEAAPALTPVPTPVRASETPEPEAEPASVPAVAPRTERVYFATRSASLDGRARARLRAVAADAGTAGEIVLEGHADHRGDEARNAHLSRERAVAVEAFLVAQGIARDRIRVGYAGEADALDTELWRDRRVDIQLTGGPR